MQRGVYLSPLQTLRLFQERQATDPRDKVFGLLGLLRHHFLDPDYSVPRDEIYVQTAMKIIESSNSLDLLANSNANPSLNPSWCPDWSMTPRHNEHQRFQYLSLYDASKGLSPQPSFRFHESSISILETRGVWADCVHCVINYNAPDDGFSLQRFQNTIGNWEDRVRRRLNFEGTLFREDYQHTEQNQAENLPDEMWRSEGYDEAFWKALCGDLVFTRGNQVNKTGGSYRRASTADFQSYKAALEIGGPTVGMSRSRLTRKIRSSDDGSSSSRGPAYFGIGYQRQPRSYFRYEQPRSMNLTQNRSLFAMQLMAGGRYMFVTETAVLVLGQLICSLVMASLYCQELLYRSLYEHPIPSRWTVSWRRRLRQWDFDEHRKGYGKWRFPNRLLIRVKKFIKLIRLWVMFMSRG